MNYTEDEFQEICWGDHEDFKTIKGEKVIDTSRWSKFMEMIVQQISTKKYYRISWQAPATEMQDCDPDYNMVEVEPVQVTVTKYKDI